MIKFPNVKCTVGFQSTWNELTTIVYDRPKDQLPMFNFANDTSAKGTPDSKTSAIILDYDDGSITFDEWISNHKGFRYFAYTTASNSKSKSKFRVVIPLRNWYSFTDIAIYVRIKFAHIDQSTTARGRRFYWPSKYDADRNITRRYLNVSDAALDMLEDIESIAGLHNFLDTSGDEFVRKSGSHADCSKFESVVAYLNTPYPKIKGNGGASRNGLFSSIGACIKFNDEATLEKVIEKALAEHWSRKEIDNIIDFFEKDSK